ncbi:hypothetical protein O9H85_08155 [Paenibacillus filicis]|uniref:DUF3168 domain-containing protein n=1 Tax=Paenibacillus gyeongsangnamensis TaxID=3388067 RepID=A0ABT4Q6B1_9BACL|nr:hypothetical protein [Paenibacillus filicis]MCZ8512405.1 hypothetical protein [Paenibacillus filicis]
MSRTSIKQSIKNLLVNVPGVTSVYTNQPKLIQDSDCPVITISLDKTHEKGVNGHRRHQFYTVYLYIQSIDYNPDEMVSEKAFDDLLDAIDNALRSDYTLGGTVLQSAWDYIDTEFFPPVATSNSTGICMRAIKTFEIKTEIIA